MENSNNFDLSSVVNLILSNPTLVEEIAKLRRRGDTAAPTEPTSVASAAAPIEEIPDPPTEQAPPPENETSSAHDDGKDTVATAATPREMGKKESRKQLFAALRPYISENRSRTLDSMEAIAAILEAVRG